MESQKLTIHGLEGKTGYNPTVPFRHNGQLYMGVRVESLDDELNTEVYFAKCVNDNLSEWEIDRNIRSLQLQDPAYMEIGGEKVLAGVKVWQERDKIAWKQDFYRGDSIDNLKHFASGPEGMKDIRLVDLKDRVGVFTRPQGGEYGAGKIAYLEVENLDNLASFKRDDWMSGKVLDLFGEGQWGGVNQAVALDDGRILAIGHVAHQTGSGEDLEKFYDAMAFKFNPDTEELSKMEVIATRKDFPSCDSKRSPELDGVVFSSGIFEGYLYVGLGDRYCGMKKIDLPFDVNLDVNCSRRVHANI